MTRLQGEGDILRLIADDPAMMAVLGVVRRQALPDWWIGAGFVRAKVWDYLHDFRQATELDDIDVLYHDSADTRRRAEADIEARLRATDGGQPWSVKNQARMHLRNGDRPYRDTTEAMAHWLETPTCVAVTLGADGELRLAAPYGLADLLDLTVRPTPSALRRPAEYRQRLRAKDWAGRWPRLRIIAT
ncbi:MAG: nucleotidyltransferase family protein [Alphaproteobacteria bacterium]|jgi:hypothetical protein|nr:nucleotidyltransferase family protein [Alphaproteobacteria bacterium]MDP6567555.1 nucleotidyltransferase family protein [Alphaproteobacteria bacterium]MDP6812769.1 nucleotidyltransferase family protein [Alphaproteobacteria bacterium]